MTQGRRASGLLAALVALAVVGSPALSGDDKSQMTERAGQWQDAFNAGNADAIAAMYTEDGIRLAYQAPTVKGRAAIVTNLQASYDAGMAGIELEVLGAESHGTMGWAHGTYVLMDDTGAVAQQGKWMNVSKKVDGKWLIHADIWNTNAPD